MRGLEILAALDRAAADGSSLLVTGVTSDLYVLDDGLIQLPQLVAAWSARRGQPTIRYSLAAGLAAMTAPGVQPMPVPRPEDFRSRDPEVEVGKVFDAVHRSATPATVILDFAEAVLPDENTSTALSIGQSHVRELVVSKALDAGWCAAGHRLIVITRETELHRSVTSIPGFTTVRLGLPSEDERSRAVRLMSASGSHPLCLADDTDQASLARLSGGMTLDALSRLRHTSSSDCPLERSMIVAYKKQIIRKMAGGTLTVYDETRDIDRDVAGLPQVRLYLADMASIGTQTLRLILCGPPGTGKTLVALAIGGWLGVPVVSLSQIKSMFVGESERALRTALDVVRSLAPVLVVLDEFDQNFGGSRASSASRESSSVESSLRGMLMEFTGDHAEDNGISIIGMSNNPGGIDAAFLSRFKVIPILEPSSPAAMTDVAVKNVGKLRAQVNPDELARAFALVQDVVSARDVVNLVSAAKVHACRDGRDVIGYADVAQAIRESQHFSGDRERLQALSAVAFTDSCRYLPWMAAAELGDPPTRPPSYLDGFVSPDGTIAMEPLRHEIDRLQAHAY